MSIEDKKYKELRNKLDELHYPQTLHPSCTDLVDKLLTDYFKLVTKMEKDKKKNSAPTVKESNNTFLQEQINLLEQRNNKLKKELEAAENSKGEANTEIKISKLQTTLHEFKVKYDHTLEEYSQNKSSLQANVQQLSSKNAILAKENEKLKDLLSQKGKQYQNYNEELTAIINKKNKEIKEHEEQTSKLRLQCSSLEGIISEQKRQSLMTQESDANPKIIEVLKEQLHQAQEKLEKTKAAMESENSEKQRVKQQNQRLQEKIQELKHQEFKYASTQSIQKNMQQKLTAVNEETREMLDQKIRQQEGLLNDNESQREEISRMEIKIKELINKNKILNDNLCNMQTELEHTTSKLNQKVKEARESENYKITLERQVREATEQAKHKDEQILELEHTSATSYNSESLIKQLQTKEKEIKLLNQEIKEFKKYEHEILIEKDKKHIEIKKLNAIIEDSNKQMELAAAQREHLIRENKALSEQVESGNMTDEESRNAIVRLREQCRNYEVHIKDLQQSLKEEQRNCKILNSQVLKGQEEIRLEKENNKNMNNDQKHLATQIRDIEHRRKEILEELQKEKSKNHLNQDNRVDLSRQVDAMEIEIRKLQDDNYRQEQAILTIDSERDEMQELVDRKTAENQELRQKLLRQEKELSLQGRDANQYEFSINSMQKMIATLEAETQQLNLELKETYTGLKESNEQLGRWEQEAKSLENELHLVVISNKQYEKQRDRALNKVVELDKKIKEKYRQYEEEYEKVIQMQTINKEITESLQTERREIERLNQYIQQFEEENHRMFDILSGKDEEIEQYKCAIDEYGRKQAQYLKEIYSFEKQLSFIEEDLERKELEIQDLTVEKNCYKTEMNWKAESKVNASKQLIYEEKFKHLQKEISNKKSQNDQLRLKTKKLESALSEEMTKTFKMSQIIEKSRLREEQTPIKNLWSETLLDNSNLMVRSDRSKSGICYANDCLISPNESIDSRQVIERVKKIEKEYEAVSKEIGSHQR